MKLGLLNEKNMTELAIMHYTLKIISEETMIPRAILDMEIKRNF